MNQPMTYTNKLCEASNNAANKFITETQHVQLNANEEDGETIIRAIRGMAYGAGFDEGFMTALRMLEDYQMEYSASTNYLSDGIDELREFAGIKKEVVDIEGLL